jgi:D-amino peptidase
MKVYIAADFEGASGAVSGYQMKPGNYEYDETRRIWMKDLNAAIEGALEAGATKVLVNEGHSPCRNIAPEDLHPEAEFISGYLKKGQQAAGLDSSFDAAFLFAHSMAGTENGVLSHTILGREIYDLRINGQRMGELGIIAAVAGKYGVPVALVVGDSAVGLEAKDLLGEETICVAVKEGIDRYTAQCLAPKKARFLIKEGAKLAIKSLKKIKPFQVGSPVKLEVEFSGPSMAYFATYIPGVKRINNRTVSFEDQDILIAYHVLVVMINLAKLPFVNDPAYG